MFSCIAIQESLYCMLCQVLKSSLQVQVNPTISHRFEVCIFLHRSFFNMAQWVIGKFTKKWRRKHGWVRTYARRDTWDPCTLDGYEDVEASPKFKLVVKVSWKPNPDIELDDELREVDLDLFT